MSRVAIDADEADEEVGRPASQETDYDRETHLDYLPLGGGHHLLGDAEGLPAWRWDVLRGQYQLHGAETDGTSGSAVVAGGATMVDHMDTDPFLGEGGFCTGPDDVDDVGVTEGHDDGGHDEDIAGEEGEVNLALPWRRVALTTTTVLDVTARVHVVVGLNEYE